MRAFTNPRPPHRSCQPKAAGGVSTQARQPERGTRDDRAAPTRPTARLDPAAAPRHHRPARDLTEECLALANDRELDALLRRLERRAWTLARLALGDEEDALDAVQDTMVRLVERYADRPIEECRALFYRILHNRIADALRARARHRFDGGGEAAAAAAAEHQAAGPASPPDALARELALAALGTALAELPRRQREAFALRVLEGLDVNDTAAAMGCSPGSVKTHLARALAALRERLGAHWP
ncbi:MAG: hypothetical protein KatS3mg121_0810 [Gammaproteobacteria bacterium]|nr:MAG: hypothetical protein KatS3mg121_0810 [Gammaproteobacteria bacterium]